MGAPSGRSAQPHEKLRIGLDPVEQSSKRCRIANCKIARVIAAKQADRAIDARGQDRDTGGEGFGYDISPALAHG